MLLQCSLTRLANNLVFLCCAACALAAFLGRFSACRFKVSGGRERHMVSTELSRVFVALHVGEVLVKSRSGVSVGRASYEKSTPESD
jgi:hypothetical protein